MVLAGLGLTAAGCGSDGLGPGVGARGYRLVYQRGGNLVISNADGTDRRALTTLDDAHDDFHVFAAAPSPDGRQIVFAMERDLWRVRPDGTGLSQLTADPWSREDYPSWAPDGRHLVYQAYFDGTPDLALRDAEGRRPPVRLTAGAGSNETPAWRPTGESIAFVSDRDGRRGVYLMEPDGSHPRRLTPDSIVASFPAWSPDGQELAFYGVLEGWGGFLLVVRADGTALERIATLPIAGPPAWAPSGNALVVTTFLGGRPKLLEISRDGRRRVLLTQDDAEERDAAWIRLGE